MINYKNIYFLGIGGIGMSALARYFHKRNCIVSGYDRTRTDLTIELEKSGIQISYNDDISTIQIFPELVIWTPAIPRENIIYQYFVSNAVPMMKRSEILGLITSQKNNIAIAGTHGKTSTSSLLAHLLAHVNFSFTAFLGGIANNYHTNYIDLGNEWMLEEADEYDRSFLKLKPSIAVIGSLDADHLDIYKTRSSMIDSYLEFANNLSNGLLLMSNQIEKSMLIRFKESISSNNRFLTFGLKDADVTCHIQKIENSWTEFSYSDDNHRIFESLSIRFPGQHNIINATAAIRISLELGLSEVQIREGLLSFKGIHRRFEWVHEGRQVLIDDYAHHPEELKVAIQAARNCYPNRKITGIFQPHLYSRTRDFAKEFAEVLNELDEIILVELYPARENPIEGISSLSILEKMTNKRSSFVMKKDLLDFLEPKELDVVILLGAGDLSDLRLEIKEILS
ncbi:MAG: UDP-N-acetylmuramate--L-alanine ligase [Saprospiraceae bacterium]|nr:UDP-N-acetylmuramate--L-alanine ligase [Saprospiraceae bacterium]